MLTISQDAAEMLAGLRDERDMPSDATLRIATPSDGTEPGVTLGFVDEPFSGDIVDEVHGLPVCIAPDTAEVLESAVLDVVADAEGTRLVLLPAAD